MARPTVPLDHPNYIPQLVAHLRSQFPPGHRDLRSISDMAREQGKGPVDWERINRILREEGDVFYEGFDVDLKRMRRGLDPIGPTK